MLMVEKLGYTGKELHDFVAEQSDAANREEKDIQIFEREERKLQRAMKQEEIELEKLTLKTARLQLAASKISNDRTSVHETGEEERDDESTSSVHRIGLKRGPNLPYFDENKYQIDAYLRRYVKTRRLTERTRRRKSIISECAAEGESTRCLSSSC